MASEASPLKGGVAVRRRGALLLAFAAIALLTVVVIVAAVARVPSVMLLEEGFANQRQVLEQPEFNEDEDIDEEIGHDYEPQEQEDEEPAEEEVPEEEDMESPDPEPEQVEEREHHHIFTKVAHYASLHPVFKRCMAKAQMHAFSHEIVKSCGNIHELTTCAYPCWRAMTMYSDRVGCCWETVMEGYRHLDWSAFHAWRHWQGTLSGKCGITFEQDQCGESMGEKPFDDLKATVAHLTAQAADNGAAISEIKYPHGYHRHHDDEYDYDYDYDDDDEGRRDAEPDAEDDDDGGAYDDDYADEEWHVEPEAETRHFAPDPEARISRQEEAGGGEEEKGAVSGEGAAAGEEREEEEEERGEPLGDEVFDLPIGAGEDMGDVHVPAEQLHPYMFTANREPSPAEKEAKEEEEEEEYEDDGSHRMGKVHMRQTNRQALLANAIPRNAFQGHRPQLRPRNY